MKNCVSTAQAAADRGSAAPGNRENIWNNYLRAITPHTLVCLQVTKLVQKWSPKITPLGVGDSICSTFWTLGCRAVQKASRKPPRDAPGTPNGRPKVSKGAKMEPQSSKKLENNVKNNFSKKQTNETETNKGKLYCGKPSQPHLASPAWPTQPCQHRQPGPASQPSQHSTANTPQPTSLEWGPAAGGVALKIYFGIYYLSQ